MAPLVSTGLVGGSPLRSWFRRGWPDHVVSGFLGAPLLSLGFAAGGARM